MKHKAIFNLYGNAKNINEENGVIEVLDDNGNEEWKLLIGTS